jgi:hypothetical protein
MAEVADKPSPHVLIVTGPQRERLYRRFSSLFAGRDGVEVMIDRRVADRRRAERVPSDGERRRAERRRKRPDWIVPPS